MNRRDLFKTLISVPAVEKLIPVVSLETKQPVEPNQFKHYNVSFPENFYGSCSSYVWNIDPYNLKKVLKKM